MIKVERIEAPKILNDNATNWTTAYVDAKRKLKNDPKNVKLKDAVSKAEKKYGHPKIREQLNTMFQGKCAFCEAYILHNSYPHIEHFRPKSKFPALCFEWKNLLLACGICNGSANKGVKFPDEAEGGPLVNPVEEDPNDFFRFEFDPLTATANVLEKNVRGKTSLETYGLNRQDLIRHRSRAIHNISFIANKAAEGNAELKAHLIELCQGSQEYTAFIREIANAFGIVWQK